MADASIRGRFSWHELMTTDPPAAVDFYSKVVGWGTQPFPGTGTPYTTWTKSGQPVGGLGPEAVLSPDQQETFRLFRAAAPDVPVDIVINIARNPAAARAYLTSS